MTRERKHVEEQRTHLRGLKRPRPAGMSAADVNNNDNKEPGVRFLRRRRHNGDEGYAAGRWENNGGKDAAANDGDQFTSNRLGQPIPILLLDGIPSPRPLRTMKPSGVSDSSNFEIRIRRQVDQRQLLD